MCFPVPKNFGSHVRTALSFVLVHNELKKPWQPVLSFDKHEAKRGKARLKTMFLSQIRNDAMLSKT